MNNKILQIREAAPNDWINFRDLRLEGLQNHPEAFGADYETDKNLPQSFWKQNLETNEMKTIFVAEAEGKLIGMSGIIRHASPKMSHSAVIWGVYVSPEYRKEKVGGKLIDACVEWAKRKNLVSVKLAVATTNMSAIRLYARCGFQVYGVEPKVILVGDVFFDELLMNRTL